MHCQSCGLPIAPTTQVCPRCGKPIVPDSQPGQSMSPRGSSPSTEQFPWHGQPVATQQPFPTQSGPYQQHTANQPPQWNNAQQSPIQNMPSGAFGQMAHSGPVQPQQGATGFPPGQMQGEYPNIPRTTSGLVHSPIVDIQQPAQDFSQLRDNARITAPAQPGPIQPQAFPSGSFPHAPMQSGPFISQAFNSNGFSSTPAQPQAYLGSSSPSTPILSGPIQPQTFSGGPFPSTSSQSRPVQSEPFAGPSFPPASLQSGPILPQALNSGALPFSTMRPLQPPALNGRPVPFNSTQSSPAQPTDFNNGSFPYTAGNGPVAFQAAPGYVQQQSPVGAFRSASVIQPIKTSSSRKILIAVGTGFLVALLAAVGYLAFLQKPATTQITPAARPILQTHPKKLPSLPPITASDPMALYTQAISREAISNDPLSTQSDNDWETVNSSGSCTFDGNTLHAVNSSTDARTTMCIAHATKYKNIAFQAQITAIKGDTYGLIVRADSKGRLLYLFSITSTGTYTLASANGQNGTLAHVLTGGTSSAIKQGQNQSNQLAIIARDNTLYLYVNQKFLTKVDDTTSAIGSVGLFVGNSQGDVSEARFTNAKMWSI